MGENLTKVCVTCGRELPISEFHKNVKTKDGFQSKCKNCTREYNKSYYRKESKARISLTKIYSNPELAKFQPRELIAELRARGYSGELSIRQVITV